MTLAKRNTSTVTINGRVHDTNDAENCFASLAVAHEAVDRAEGAVEDLKKQLEYATNRLKQRRDEFDQVRALTLEFCPALESGFGAMKLTETVAIVDGTITVVPIEQSGRPSRPSYEAEQTT